MRFSISFFFFSSVFSTTYLQFYVNDNITPWSCLCVLAHCGLFCIPFLAAPCAPFPVVSNVIINLQDISWLTIPHLPPFSWFQMRVHLPHQFSHDLDLPFPLIKFISPFFCAAVPEPGAGTRVWWCSPAKCNNLILSYDVIILNFITLLIIISRPLSSGKWVRESSFKLTQMALHQSQPTSEVPPTPLYISFIKTVFVCPTEQRKPAPKWFDSYLTLEQISLEYTPLTYQLSLGSQHAPWPHRQSPSAHSKRPISTCCLSYQLDG